MTARVLLQAKKARPFFGRHPWVYAGAIERIEGSPSPGGPVEVLTHEKQFIAHGLYNPASNIRVRLYSWDQEKPIDSALIVERMEKAIRFRHEDLRMSDPAGGCRLVCSESDGLSGLVIDRYADVVVVQFTSLAMAGFQEVIVQTLDRLLSPRSIYRRTERGIGELEDLQLDDAPLAGEPPSGPIAINENCVIHIVDPFTGQKTGGYLDQRDNRKAVARYAKGRSVLDVFCYGGGFGITAAAIGGASSMMGVDISGPALTLAQRAAEANGIGAEFLKEDAQAAMARLRKEGRRFGLISLDPPKFARTPGAAANALKGYQNLNTLAIELLGPGGVLATSSCSGHVSAEQFLETIVAASQRAQRHLHILEQRGQAPDHPVSSYCLQTAYLKCIIARAAE